MLLYNARCMYCKENVQSYISHELLFWETSKWLKRNCRKKMGNKLGHWCVLCYVLYTLQCLDNAETSPYHTA